MYNPNKLYTCLTCGSPTSCYHGRYCDYLVRILFSEEKKRQRSYLKMVAIQYVKLETDILSAWRGRLNLPYKLFRGGRHGQGQPSERNQDFLDPTENFCPSRPTLKKFIAFAFLKATYLQISY